MTIAQAIAQHIGALPEQGCATDGGKWLNKSEMSEIGGQPTSSLLFHVHEN